MVLRARSLGLLMDQNDTSGSVDLGNVKDRTLENHEGCGTRRTDSWRCTRGLDLHKLLSETEDELPLPTGPKDL